MFKPTTMTRVTLSGLKKDLERVSNNLAEERMIHLVEYENNYDGFETGESLHYGEKTSEALVRVRSLIKMLNVEPMAPSMLRTSEELSDGIDERLNDVENKAVELRDKIREMSQEVEESKTRIELLSAFSGLGINLELMTGYENLDVFTGKLTGEIDIEDVEEIRTDEMTAIFSPKNKSEEVEKQLMKLGFKSIAPPKGEGNPEKEYELIKETVDKRETEMEALQYEMEALALREGHWLIVIEEHLSTKVEKANLPLKLALSENTFTLDGWIPESEFGKLKRAVENVEIHIEEGDGEGEPPVKLENKEVVKPFELFTKLYGIPNHREFDPTALLFLAYPLFFGMMIGDLGYGLVYFLMGHMIVKKFGHVSDTAAFGRIIRTAGLWTIVFGTLVFTEAFGKPIGLAEYLPGWMTLDKHLSDDVATMLQISFGIGMGYVTLGLLIGFYNVMNLHGFKHAAEEKLSWLMIMWGGLVYIPILLFGQELIPGTGTLETPALILFLMGTALAVYGEGAIALVELPSVFVHVISYVRIAALGLADFGLATAVNRIALQDIGMEGTNIIFAILVLLLGHIVIVVIGLIGSGINSLRLQYVECFPKFFQGGGTDYTPFGHARIYTKKMEATT